MDLLECDVREHLGPPTESLAAIAAYVAAHPEKEWIVGSGWYMGDFENGTPRREDLDAIVPDRPAFLPNRDGHSSVGQQPRRSSSPASTRRRRTRPTAGSSAIRTGRRRARSTRAPPTSSSA